MRSAQCSRAGLSIFDSHPKPQQKGKHHGRLFYQLQLYRAPARYRCPRIRARSGRQRQFDSTGSRTARRLSARLRGLTEDWWFEAEAQNSGRRCGLWLHSENGGLDAVCAFIQHLLQKYSSTEPVTLEWSHDCSKPRTDAYGGGAAIITATEIKTMSTAQWIQENIGLLTPPEPYA